MFPLELQQEIWASSRVATETWDSSLVVAGNSGCPLELLPGTQRSCPCAAGNQCFPGIAAQDAGFHWSCQGTWGSSRAWLVLRVPCDLWWGLLSSSLGVTHLEQ